MLRIANELFIFLRRRSVALATALILFMSTALALALVALFVPLLNRFGFGLPLEGLLVTTVLVTPVVTLPFSLGFSFFIRQLTTARHHLRNEVNLHLQAREDLLEATARAEEASMAKSRFMASMSHELRTPLTAIIGFSEILGHDVIPDLNREKTRQYGQDIARSAHHLLSLIDDILDLSRIEAAELALQEETVAVRAVIEDAAQMSGAVFERHGAVLHRSPDEPDFALRADRRRLCQVLINVLTNAAKYGNRTPVHLEVMRNGEGGAVFTVSDSGPGMNAMEIVEALRPFGRTEAATRMPIDGMGLGLPIAEQIVRLHDGTLRIESVPGRGSRVIVTLPAERVMSSVADNATGQPVSA